MESIESGADVGANVHWPSAARESLRLPSAMRRDFMGKQPFLRRLIDQV
jgi:hypothetical protein